MCETAKPPFSFLAPQGSRGNQEHFGIIQKDVPRKKKEMARICVEIDLGKNRSSLQYV